jgi:SAM-dependent methyltransferase
LLKPGSILEIGIGNGFISKYLVERGFGITTMDVDRNLYPTLVGTVLSIPFSNSAFDVVACFQVLEHLPYEAFSENIAELCRVSRFYVLLSLPDVSTVWCLSVQIPHIEKNHFALKTVRILLPIPSVSKRAHRFDGQHYWEIGKIDYSLKRIINDIEKTGLVVEETYRVFEWPYHRIFKLKKTNATCARP